MITVDGITYEDESQAPNLGNWASGDRNGMRCDYYGLSTELSLLPKYVASGSTAYCVDTAEVWIFLETTKTWYNGSGGEV